MSLLFARIVASVAIFCAPFFLFIVASGQPENTMLLIFPVFGAIPAILAALILFLPAEALLDRFGLPAAKNVVIPALGAAIVFLVLLALARFFDNFEVLQRNMRTQPEMFWGVLAVWSLLGIGWGVVWRMTEWIARRMLPVRG